jgi:hypothetical protein
MINSLLNGLLSISLLMGSKKQEPANQVYVDPLTRAIRDPEGRHLIFHGVNVVYKMAPYYPSHEFNTPWDKDNSLNRQDLRLLKKWGMNFVRLGVIWEAVETAPGVYN